MPHNDIHFQKAITYAEDVLAGKIPTCKWTKLACERQLKDLKRKYHKIKWPYTFSIERAEKICNFIENLQHVKGDKAWTKIELEPWQCFYLTTLFGWINKETNKRRFRISYLEVARKNAKSTISAGIALYMATADNEIGAECYAAATTEKQAKIVLDVARKMAKRSRQLQRFYDLSINASNIIVEKTDSAIEAVSAQANNLDGLNIHFASVDELHAHKTRAVYDVIETACGARSQSLLSVITTAGSDITGICYELHTYVKKILENIFQDETFFGLIYTIDEDDDWTSELAFKKANPNYGISVEPKQLRSLCDKARRSISSQANFQTKHLNIWLRSDKAWMNMKKWNACGKQKLDIEDFKDCKCWIALDASSKLDVTALMLLFEKDGKYYVFGRYYLPQEIVEERAETTYAHYSTWAKEGLFTLTPGDVIDFTEIENDIIDLCSKFKVIDVAYDPWQTTQLATRLSERGISMVEVRQTLQSMSEPMKQLEALIWEKKIEHGACPVLTWMMSNVVAHVDKNDNIKANKERPANKIDGVVGLIMCLARAIVNPEEKVSVYESRGIATA